MIIDCQPHVHLAAYHAEAGYSNDTPGVGLLCRSNEDWRVAAGTYLNSLKKQSTYVGAAWQPWSVGPARVGLFGGAVTGYRDGVIPFGAGVVSLPLGRAELHLIAIPAVSGTTPATLELSIVLGLR
jgi:hypothetical protein